MRRATADWLQQANPLPAFLQECCGCDPASSCLMADLYAAYGEWAAEMGITLKQQQLSFRRNLEHLGFVVKKGNRGRKVMGVYLKG